MYAIRSYYVFAFVSSGHAGELTPRLFMDVHELDSVTAEAVADAHLKDLAVQDQFGVSFIRYWVDEENAKVYCLAEAPDAAAVSSAHARAHGLIPQQVHEVTDGVEDSASGRITSYNVCYTKLLRLNAGRPSN